MVITWRNWSGENDVKRMSVSRKKGSWHGARAEKTVPASPNVGAWGIGRVAVLCGFEGGMSW